MKPSTGCKLVRRGLTTLLFMGLIATLALGQNLVIGSGSTYTGAGSYVVKGNITNSGVAAATSIAGTVTMSSTTAAQTIGTGGQGDINFQTLNVNTTGTPTSTMNVAVAVSTALSVASGTTLAVGTNALTLSGTSTLNGGGFLTTAAGSTVTYNANGQTVLGGFAYNGNLTLSTGTKTIGSLVTVGQAFNHTGGTLTISGGGITLGTSSAFADVTMTSGTITGGSGLATFNGLLTKSASDLTSGSGGLSLLAGLTNTSGNVTVGASRSMSIAGGQFAYTAGTLSFDAASTVTYGASATTIVDAAYGNLTLNADAKSWALGVPRTIGGNLTLGASAATNVTGANDLTVLGSVSLAANLTKAASAVVFTNATSAVSGTGFEIIGSVTRTHAFAASAYTFNNASMTLTPSVFASLTSFTMKSEPSVPPGGYNPGNTVNRKYTPSYTGTFTADLKLSYLASELAGAIEAKLKQFQGGTINAGTKLAGTYTRVPAGTFGTISLASLTNVTLANASEMALDDRFGTYTSLLATNWNAGTTWDEGTVPGASDVVIINTSPVTVPDGNAASALSVTINATMGLVVGGGASGSLAVGTGGLTNNSAATGLTVSAGGAVTITLGNLTNSGAITNAGTITVQ